MGYAVIVVSLKSKEVCDEAERHSLKSEMTTNRMQHRKGKHEDAGGFAELKFPSNNNHKSYEQKYWNVLSPPYPAFIWIDCADGENCEVDEKADV